MKVKWNFESGYVHRIPDFTLEIDDEEIEGMGDIERENYIDDCVREAFLQRVRYHWKEV